MLSQEKVDLEALAKAFELFNETTRTMEESYRRLEQRLAQMDRQLAEKNRELELTSDYLRGVLESMSDGVIAVDTAERITTFNRAASAALGYAAEDVAGRPFRDVFGRDFITPPGPRYMELRAQGGAMIPVTESDSPLSDREGRRLGWVKVFHDVREVEDLREQIRRKDRLAAIGEMATTVAHEIRNPLGGIRGFAALLAKDVDADDPRARLVDKILSGARELDRVVTELLEYARPVQLRLRSTPCEDVVDAALGYLEPLRAGVKITKSIPPGVLVMADPDKMRQALLNILLNAVQSIADEGRIDITSEAGRQHVALVIRDTGCGMTPEQLERAFAPFYTTKEKGTGLGLAVCAKIIEAHGGAIEATSQPGIGSTFSIRLPKAI